MVRLLNHTLFFSIKKVFNGTYNTESLWETKTGDDDTSVGATWLYSRIHHWMWWIKKENLHGTRTKRVASSLFLKALSEGNLGQINIWKGIDSFSLSGQALMALLVGCKFSVPIDQKASRSLLEQRITTPDQQHWLAKLVEYNMEVKYKPRHDNRATDALSHLLEHTEFKAIS